MGWFAEDGIMFSFYFVRDDLSEPDRFPLCSGGDRPHRAAASRLGSS